MALYDYKCGSCGRVVEIDHKMGDAIEVTCPDCGNTGIGRVIATTNPVIYLGEGFTLKKEFKRKK